MGIGKSNKKCHFIIGKSHNNPVGIVQLLIMSRLDIWLNLKSNIAYMFYSWTFSHSTHVPLMFVKYEYYFCDYGDTSVCSWGVSYK